MGMLMIGRENLLVLLKMVLKLDVQDHGDEFAVSGGSMGAEVFTLPYLRPTPLGKDIRVSHPSEHPDQAVRRALIELADALCSWERNTSRGSTLIYLEQGGFHFRAVDGKPVDSATGTAHRCLITDEELLRQQAARG
jgi:hypothetical protein